MSGACGVFRHQDVLEPEAYEPEFVPQAESGAEALTGVVVPAKTGAAAAAVEEEQAAPAERPAVVSDEWVDRIRKFNKKD